MIQPINKIKDHQIGFWKELNDDDRRFYNFTVELSQPDFIKKLEEYLNYSLKNDNTAWQNGWYNSPGRRPQSIRWAKMYVNGEREKDRGKEEKNKKKKKERNENMKKVAITTIVGILITIIGAIISKLCGI